MIPPELRRPVPEAMTSLEELEPATPGLGRRGLGLVVASVVELVFQWGALTFLVSYGIWWWSSHFNPDPGGFFGTFFIGLMIVLFVAALLSVFYVFSYVAWYRSATTLGERREVERRWIGVLVAFSGAPFLVFGALFFDMVGVLLLLGALMAFVVGVLTFATAAPRGKAARA